MSETSEDYELFHYGAAQNPIVRRNVTNAAKTTYSAAMNNPVTVTDAVKKQSRHRRSKETVWRMK